MMTDRKIVVLDDDPTGTQTVHGVSVYTDWEEETFREAFAREEKMFFVLTNSRSFTEERTREVHRLIAHRLCQAARQSGTDFLVISRGDSTLRGHFPLETETLREVIEAEMGYRFGGEILCPFFPEGNRVTKDDIHYVIDKDRWIPVGESEFAKDATFGYHSSNLREYVEEKTKGKYTADSCISFSVKELQDGNIEALTDKLCMAEDFRKIIVNALDYTMLETFCRAFCEAVQRGHHFLMRTAASFPKVLGEITDMELLTRAQIIEEGNHAGGLIIAGSHVGRTTAQLEKLKSLEGRIRYTEFDAGRVKEAGGLEREADRVAELISEQIAGGNTAVVYTSRILIRGADEQESLRLSVRISEVFTGIVKKLKCRPAFIIAKGGITSSDVATKSLHIRQAEVMGQIRPGIPVWQSGEESLFPGLPYIIFPGNVGDENTLYDIVKELIHEE